MGVESIRARATHPPTTDTRADPPTHPVSTRRCPLAQRRAARVPNASSHPSSLLHVSTNTSHYSASLVHPTPSHVVAPMHGLGPSDPQRARLLPPNRFTLEHTPLFSLRLIAKRPIARPWIRKISAESSMSATFPIFIRGVWCVDIVVRPV